jgi:hypothetical protein
MSPPLTTDELLVAEPPGAWRAAGFQVEDDLCIVGDVGLRFGNFGRGIVGWSVRGAATLELDGIPTTASENPPRAMRSIRNVQRNIAASHAGPLSPDERERLRAHRWVRNFYE